MFEAVFFSIVTRKMGLVNSGDLRGDKRRSRTIINHLERGKKVEQIKSIE